MVNHRWQAVRGGIADCTFYLDGSGFNTNVPQLARYGFAIVIIGPDGNLGVLGRGNFAATVAVIAAAAAAVATFVL